MNPLDDCFQRSLAEWRAEKEEMRRDKITDYSQLDAVEDLIVRSFLASKAGKRYIIEAALDMPFSEWPEDIKLDGTSAGRKLRELGQHTEGDK
jgi:hypothetical protein